MSNQITNNHYNLNDAIIRQAEKIKPTPGKSQAVNQQLNGQKTFQEILNKQLNNEITFSKHANQRTVDRNIEISQTDLARLGEACDKAQNKGIKDALIMMNDTAFIVNAPNKVVVTVMEKNEMKNNVISNINGAIFI
ncbi:MAG: TIGR02530 family flagellar biosynthesis protein [Anaerovoracaceae bacterium]|jgi:flagellar operon protein